MADHGKILYVGGLAEEVKEAVLHAAFLPFGPIETVQIPLDHKTQENRGFGFVQFEDMDDAASALDNMHSTCCCLLLLLTGRGRGGWSPPVARYLRHHLLRGAVLTLIPHAPPHARCCCPHAAAHCRRRVVWTSIDGERRETDED